MHLEGLEWPLLSGDDHLALAVRLTGIRSLEVYLQRASGPRFWASIYPSSPSVLSIMGFALSLHAWLKLGILHDLVNVQDLQNDTAFRGSEDLDLARQIKHHLFAFCLRISNHAP